MKERDGETTGQRNNETTEMWSTRFFSCSQLPHYVSRFYASTGGQLVDSWWTTAGWLTYGWLAAGPAGWRSTRKSCRPRQMPRIRHFILRHQKTAGIDTMRPSHRSRGLAFQPTNPVVATSLRLTARCPLSLSNTRLRLCHFFNR